MTQQVRTLVTLPQDQGWSLITHLLIYRLLYLQPQRLYRPFLVSLAAACMWYTGIYAGRTPTHIKLEA